MSDPVTLRNLRDSFVNSAKPTKNFSSLARLKASGTTIYSLIYAGTPWPPGATITYAALKLWNSELWSGSVTITLQRLSGSWSGSRVNWNNKPGVTGPTYTLTKTDAAADTMWEIPITAMIQLIANGGDWYGLQISVNGSTVRKMYSTQSDNINMRPQLVVQWADSPEVPDNLVPNDNFAVASSKPTFAYNFTDTNGDSLAMHQIQISTDPTFATTAYDSGWVTTSAAQFDTSATAWAGLTDGASIYWRVRVQDSSGAQSSWSLAAQFKYVSKGTLASTTLGGPNGGGQYFVYDTTPPVLWTLTGRTQAAYRVFITDLDNAGVTIFDTGKITGTTNTIDTGSGGVTTVLPRVGGNYRLYIQVWDNIPRQKTPDQSSIYYEYKQDFVYLPDNTVSAPTGLTASLATPYPWVDLAFSRSTPPDSFTIIRDGNVVEANLLAADLLVSGTNYAYRDRKASPRVQHTWVVKANVNGKDSQDSNSVTLTPKTNFTWMMEKDGSNPIALLKSASEPTPVVDANAQSDQEVHQPYGGDPVLITQSISGFEGHVDAVLSDNIVSGLTARTMRDRFKAWKKYPGKELLLYNIDETMTVVPYNMSYRPRVKSGGVILYDVSFDFFQVDF